MDWVKVAFVGDSHVFKLATQWAKEADDKRRGTDIRVFGRGGARLVYEDGTTFQDIYFDRVVAWKPDLIVVWIAGNDLNQNLVTGAYVQRHYNTVFEQYITLCDNFRASARRWGGRVMMMPQLPRDVLWYTMTYNQFFDQVRCFNRKFKRRHIGANRVYMQSGMFKNATCRDGVHLLPCKYEIIAQDLYDRYVMPIIRRRVWITYGYVY